MESLRLISDFITVDHGKYIVKVSVYHEDVILGSALAGEDTVEKAEDSARKRAISFVNQDISLQVSENIPKMEKNLLSPNIIESQKKESESKPAVKSIKKIENKSLSELKTQEFNSSIFNLDSQTNITKTEEILSDISSVNHEIPEVISTEEAKINNEIPEVISTEEEKINNEIPEVISPESLDFVTMENNEIPTLFDTEITQEDNRDFQDTNLILFPTPDQKESFSENLSETVDFSQIIDQTSIEMKRLGWTQDQGKKYLLEIYGKKSRHLLSDEELIEFLAYLQTQ